MCWHQGEGQGGGWGLRHTLIEEGQSHVKLSSSADSPKSQEQAGREPEVVWGRKEGYMGSTPKPTYVINLLRA